MKMREIRERSDDELDRLAAQMRDDLYQSRVQKATNQLENTASIPALRRDLARVLTLQQERVLAKSSAGQKGDSK